MQVYFCFKFKIAHKKPVFFHELLSVLPPLPSHKHTNNSEINFFLHFLTYPISLDLSQPVCVGLESGLFLAFPDPFQPFLTIL